MRNRREAEELRSTRPEFRQEYQAESNAPQVTTTAEVKYFETFGGRLVVLLPENEVILLYPWQYDMRKIKPFVGMKLTLSKDLGQKRSVDWRVIE